MKKLYKIKISKGTVFRSPTHIEYPVWQKGLHIIRDLGDITFRFNYHYKDEYFKTIELDIIFWKKWWPKDFGKEKRYSAEVERGEEDETNS